LVYYWADGEEGGGVIVWERRRGDEGWRRGVENGLERADVCVKDTWRKWAAWGRRPWDERV
jgi:hypothetical protein